MAKHSKNITFYLEYENDLYSKIVTLNVKDFLEYEVKIKILS